VNVAPLPVSFRKKLVSLLSTVNCNGEKAYTSSFLIGVGTQITLFTSWAVSWSTDTTTMKYYQSLSSIAKDQLFTLDEDYGVVSNGLSASDYELMPDVAIMPAAAYAVVPGILFVCVCVLCACVCCVCEFHLTPPNAAYYVPELDGETLVLDFNTTAAIYLAHISRWNDQRIKDLNSDIAHLLPDEPILVATATGNSAVGQLFTDMLSSTVPEFNSTVRVVIFFFFYSIGTTDAHRYWTGWRRLGGDVPRPVRPQPIARQLGSRWRYSGPEGHTLFVRLLVVP
jgi:hypothetical protein